MPAGIQDAPSGIKFSKKMAILYPPLSSRNVILILLIVFLYSETGGVVHWSQSFLKYFYGNIIKYEVIF